MTAAELAFTSDNMIEGYGSKPFDAIIDKPFASNREIRNVRLLDCSELVHTANHLFEQARGDLYVVEANDVINLGLQCPLLV